MGEVVLCRLPSLDINYKNVIDFSSTKERDAFVDNNKVYTFGYRNVKFDAEMQSITITIGIEDIHKADYLYITKGGKRYYYFITNKRVLNDTRTILNLKIDVWMTYMFDYKLLDSFVERCHQPRWNGDTPITNLVDEGLPLGEYIMESKENLYNYNNGLIITATKPLGVIKEFKPSISDTGNDGVLDSVEPPLSSDIPTLEDTSNIDGFKVINVTYNTDIMEYALGDFTIKTLLGAFSSSSGNPGQIGVYYKNRFLGSYDLGWSSSHNLHYKKATLAKVGNILYLLLGGSDENNIHNFKRVRIGNIDNLLAPMEVDSKYKIPLSTDTVPLFKTSVTQLPGLDLSLGYGDFILKFNRTNKKDTITNSYNVNAELYYKNALVHTLKLTENGINYTAPVCNLVLKSNSLMLKLGNIDYPNTAGTYELLGNIETFVERVG